MPLTTAVKVRVFPRITVAGFGLTTTEVTVPAGTLTAAVPLLPISKVDVARTVKLEEVSPDATLRRPDEFIVVEELLFPVTLQVTLCEG